MCYFAPKNILLVLIGNKSDLEENRKVDYDLGKNLTDENNMIFFETSALSGRGVDNVFNNTCQKIYENIQKDYYDLNDETCGIKKGENISEYIDISSNNEVKRNKKCCNKN